MISESINKALYLGRGGIEQGLGFQWLKVLMRGGGEFSIQLGSMCWSLLKEVLYVLGGPFFQDDYWDVRYLVNGL